MEQHPVPQNVTGFQFKLIGDMTIRQFLYLAAGVLIAYVFWQFDLPLIIKGILAGSCAAAGFAFAFMPIEERPLDRWLTSFLKSIYRPTQFLWKKNPGVPEVLTSSSARPILTNQTTVLKKEQTAARIEEYLATLKPLAPVNTAEIDQKEKQFLNQTLSSFQTIPLTPQAASPQPSEPIPVQIPTTNYQLPNTNNDPLIIEPAPPISAIPPILPPAQPPSSLSDESLMQEKIKEILAQLEKWEQKLEDKNLTKSQFVEIQAQMAYLLKEKERLTRELVRLRKTQMQKNAKPRSYTKEAPTSQTFESIVPKAPTYPNTPSGVVRTPSGAMLAGILIEIRNPEGLPVRALKTGKLGQFCVTTSLPNGQYGVIVEDPQKTYYFDPVELTLKGGIVPPLEIFAKTQKDKTREELTKKVFAKPF